MLNISLKPRALTFGAAALLALTIAAPTSAGVIIFEDAFERNNSGSLNTLGSPPTFWTETEVGSNEVSVNNNTLRLRNTNAQAAQLSLSTLGFENITISYDFIGLNSDDLDVLNVSFSTGTGFIPANTNTHILGNNMSFTSVNWSIAADNATTFQLRFSSTPDGTSAGGVALEGARIDNIVVMGDPISVPEPGTLVLFGLGLAGLSFVQRKRSVRSN